MLNTYKCCIKLFVFIVVMVPNFEVMSGKFKTVGMCSLLAEILHRNGSLFYSHF
jgi:hypothetical protein